MRVPVGYDYVLIIEWLNVDEPRLTGSELHERLRAAQVPTQLRACAKGERMYAGRWPKHISRFESRAYPRFSWKRTELIRSKASRLTSHSVQEGSQFGGALWVSGSHR